MHGLACCLFILLLVLLILEVTTLPKLTPKKREVTPDIVPRVETQTTVDLKEALIESAAPADQCPLSRWHEVWPV